MSVKQWHDEVKNIQTSTGLSYTDSMKLASQMRKTPLVDVINIFGLNRLIGKDLLIACHCNRLNTELAVHYDDMSIPIKSSNYRMLGLSTVEYIDASSECKADRRQHKLWQSIPSDSKTVIWCAYCPIGVYFGSSDRLIKKVPPFDFSYFTDDLMSRQLWTDLLVHGLRILRSGGLIIIPCKLYPETPSRLEEILNYLDVSSKVSYQFEQVSKDIPFIDHLRRSSHITHVLSILKR